MDDYNNVKHIVFGVDSNYIKYAAVTMLPIVNYNQTTKIVFLDKIYNLQTFMPVENKKIVFLHFICSLKPWFLNVNRLGSDMWKAFYQKSPWCNIQLTDKQNLKSHDYRIISKYLWRNEEYQDSIIWYLKYLKKIGVLN